MKALQELARAAQPQDMRLLLPGSSRAEAKKSLVYKLYRLALDETTTNETAVRALYGMEFTPSHPPFRSLKTRLRHILVRALGMSGGSEPDYSSYDAALIHGYRQLNIARTCIVREAFHAARDIADSTFRAVRKYEIVQLNEGLSDLLSALYLSVLYNDELFRKYQRLHHQYAQASFDLSQVAGAYRMTRSKLYMHRESAQEIGRFALERVAECEEIRKRNVGVSQIQAMIGSMEVTGYTQMGNYRMVVDAAERVQAALTESVGASTITISVMKLASIDATVRLRDFELGRQQITSAIAVMQPRTLNAIKVLEYAVLLGLRTANYTYAYEHLAKLDYRDMKRLMIHKHQESWLLLEAYVNLLIAADRLEVPPDGPKLRRFRFNRFLNDTPSYSASKKSYNIQLLIVQVCFLLIKGKYGDVIDRTDALARYCSRYLRDNENFRNNCFFKMLIEAVKANFHKERTRTKTARLYKRLSERPLESYDSINDGEIIPYEELWNIVVDHLPTSTGRFRP